MLKHSLTLFRCGCQTARLIFSISHVKPQFSARKVARNLQTMSTFAIEERGTPFTQDYRIYFRNETGPISPMHDIPVYADVEKKIVNMVVEIPRWTNAKMEISLKELLNPIRQDVKKNKLRYVANCFPHHGYIWNYGAIPQTWENPDVLDEGTGCKGDNDPVDILDIGYRVAKRGEVIQVKVLGAFALIDEGETDWKIIAIDVNDPLAEQMKDIGDVDRLMPGLLKATVEWFKIYKIPDGKQENSFAFNGEPKPRDFALNVISETNKYWAGLVAKDTPANGISCASVSVETSPFKIDQTSAADVVAKATPLSPPAPGPEPIVDLWHFLGPSVLYETDSGVGGDSDAESECESVSIPCPCACPRA